MKSVGLTIILAAILSAAVADVSHLPYLPHASQPIVSHEHYNVQPVHVQVVKHVQPQIIQTPVQHIQPQIVQVRAPQQHAIQHQQQIEIRQPIVSHQVVHQPVYHRQQIHEIQQAPIRPVIPVFQPVPQVVSHQQPHVIQQVRPQVHQAAAPVIRQLIQPIQQIHDYSAPRRVNNIQPINVPQIQPGHQQSLISHHEIQQIPVRSVSPIPVFQPVPQVVQQQPRIIQQIKQQVHRTAIPVARQLVQQIPQVQHYSEPHRVNYVQPQIVEQIHSQVHRLAPVVQAAVIHTPVSLIQPIKTQPIRTTSHVQSFIPHPQAVQQSVHQILQPQVFQDDGYNYGSRLHKKV